MKTVRFLKHFQKWNAGEIAGFEDTSAAHLVTAGLAEIVSESYSGTACQAIRLKAAYGSRARLLPII